VVEVIYLAPDDRAHEALDEERWLHVDANDGGAFYGTVWSRKPPGESVFYRSLLEDDVSLLSAINAAIEWVAKFRVRKIWVQREPWKLDSAGPLVGFPSNSAVKRSQREYEWTAGFGKRVSPSGRRSLGVSPLAGECRHLDETCRD
jgi:hypothetical protein